MRSELFKEAWKQNRHVWESTKCLAQAMYLAGEQHQQSGRPHTTRPST